jgi:hypothetical protein
VLPLVLSVVEVVVGLVGDGGGGGGGGSGGGCCCFCGCNGMLMR